MKIVRGEDRVDHRPLDSRLVSVLGFGNQGKAHALNLRDSGVNMLVGARPHSHAADSARSLHFEVADISQATRHADLAIVALPDEVHGEVYRTQIEPALRGSATLGFLHGFSMRFGMVNPRPDIGVILVAPKGPGTALRERYLQGLGLPCLFAQHQDSPARDAHAIGLAWARAIGCARAGIIYTTFAAEAETDLFGEQAVLCGGLNALITSAFEVLVEAGYDPELAYLECCHEVKQIADLIHARGLAGMREAISNTAEFGEYHAGPVLIDDQTRQRMRDLLNQVRSGEFARSFQREHAEGFRSFHARRRALNAHPIEAAGHAIRSLMPWLAEGAPGMTNPPVESSGPAGR